MSGGGGGGGIACSVSGGAFKYDYLQSYSNLVFGLSIPQFHSIQYNANDFIRSLPPG